MTRVGATCGRCKRYRSLLPVAKLPPTDDYDYKGFRGFAQNNNNSSRNFTPQSSNVKLRHQAISFVAAGTNTPDEFDPEKARPDDADIVAAEESEEEVIDLEETGEGVDDTTLQTNIVTDTDVEVSEGGIAQMNLHSSGEMCEQETGPTTSDVDMKEVEKEEELFVVDTQGDDTLAPPPKKASGKQPVRRAASPTPSDSSDEEVVFRGRVPAKTIEDPVQPRSQKAAAPPSSQPSRPDPVVAWNQAARTLPHQYKNQTSTVEVKKETPREDTIKETFKKTSGSQDRLGGHRKNEALEHTIHDSKGSRFDEVKESSTSPSKQDSAVQDEEPHVADDLLRALSAQQAEIDPWTSGPKARGWGASTSKADQEVNMEATWAPAPAGSWWKRKNKMARPDLDLTAEEKAAIDQSPSKVTKVAFAQPGSSKVTTIEPESKPTENGEEGAKETIESLQADVKEMLRNKRRAKLSTREADAIPLETSKSGSGGNSRRKRRARRKDNRTLRPAIGSDDEDDDGGEAAYDDYMANLAAQMENGDDDEDGAANFAKSSFARSNGLGGPSMVIDGEAIADDEVFKGHAELINGDEDEWESDSEDGPIGQDVSDLSSVNGPDYDDDDDDSDDEQSAKSSELEDMLEYQEREMWEDEEDLRQRRKDAMDDERLAQLLAKQQEFGYGDDDLILDDGFGMDGFGDIDDARAGLANMTNIVNGSRQNKKNKSRRSGGGRNKDFSFPDASALADTVDQYGDAGFDIMDFDRPSLRPAKKGRKGKLPAELEGLSDDEMKENMSTAWENDRAKKRLKKAEREELRAQGMLGSMGKKGKADLTEKYKYQDGMDAKQIRDELRLFMEDSGQNSRPFPPMDREMRKRLHEVASLLGLKSKSVGAGKDRFPVLYKTNRTVEFDERLFRETMRSNPETISVNVKFARKAKKMGGRGGGAVGRGGRGGGRGGGGMAAASVGHGEIVGAGAPEMGKENKGFKFMQKMGWTPGMSLGREGEGRLVPVEQMMRVGRAGLG